jgi:hypothetical protein
MSRNMGQGTPQLPNTKGLPHDLSVQGLYTTPSAMGKSADGPPAKKARPTSLQDVVLAKAGGPAAAGLGGGGAAPAANPAGRGMPTLEEVGAAVTSCR